MKKTKVALLLGCMLFVAATASAQGRKAVCINEVMVENSDNVVDDYGEHHAWIELFNSSFGSVNTARMYLTTARTHPRKYPVPRMDVNTEIPPRQHLLFWADGEPNRGTFHISFVLKPGEDNWIGLYDADGKTLIDEVVVPAFLQANQSYARKEDGVKDAKNDAAAWEVRDGSNEKYITPSGNNVIIDKNAKIEMFAEHDKWGWGMTILAMAIVLASLVLLCLSFGGIGLIYTRIARKKKQQATGKVITRAEHKETQDSGEEIAAVCMALHEHLNMHDHEDFVLTINRVKRTYSPWNSKIYSLREMPHK